jgi:predicted DNA repair protein MutK
VYGLVAGIVKLDDVGLHLTRRAGTGVGARLARGIGRGLLAAAPRLMRVLGVVGTAAMFLVGGGILTHALPALHHLGGDGFLGGLIKLLVDGGSGVVAGALVVAGVRLVHPLVSRSLRRLKGSPAD